LALFRIKIFDTAEERRETYVSCSQISHKKGKILTRMYFENWNTFFFHFLLAAMLVENKDIKFIGECIVLFVGQLKRIALRDFLFHDFTALTLNPFS
jgi:hypothetical protein